MAITMRAVREDDSPFLLGLYYSTREAELKLVPWWTDEQKRMFIEIQFQAQKAYYAAACPHATYEIIVKDDEPAGRLYLDRQGEADHILDITILPQLRGAGIGTSVLEGILRNADRVDKPVTIYVEDFNPSLRLFERLGFRVSSSDSFLLFLTRMPSDAI